MKFYKHNSGRIVVAEHFLPNFASSFLAATPTESTDPSYYATRDLEEVNFEDIKYLKYHLPKKIKNILQIQN